jgi:hypothetical protein
MAKTKTTAEQLDEALTRVLDRMGCKPETLEQAVYVVAEDFGGTAKFRALLIRAAQGYSRP